MFFKDFVFPSEEGGKGDLVPEKEIHDILIRCVAEGVCASIRLDDVFIARAQYICAIFKNDCVKSKKMLKECMESIFLNCFAQLSEKMIPDHSVIYAQEGTDLQDISIGCKEIIGRSNALAIVGGKQICDASNLPRMTCHVNHSEIDLAARRYLAALSQSGKALCENELDEITLKLISNYDSSGLNRLIDTVWHGIMDYCGHADFADAGSVCTSVKLSKTYKGAIDQIKQVCHLIRDRENQYTDQYSLKTRQAIQYIKKYYRQKILLSDIAAHVYVSEGHLNRLFKKETGKTLLEYLTAYRMRIAKELLLDTNLKIYEIAEKTGYITPQYFSTIFLKEYGVNPISFRESEGK